MWLTLLQSATALFITKCDGGVLQSATAILLQSVIEVITKCDRYYKVWLRLLQSATGITKCDDYYKVRQYKRTLVPTFQLTKFLTFEFNSSRLNTLTSCPLATPPRRRVDFIKEKHYACWGPTRSKLILTLTHTRFPNETLKTETILKVILTKIHFSERQKTLRSNQKKNKWDPTVCHDLPGQPEPPEDPEEHWHLIESQPQTGSHQRNTPIIAYRRKKCLKYFLVRPKIPWHVDKSDKKAV